MRAGLAGVIGIAVAAGSVATLVAQGPTTEKTAGEEVAVVGCVTKAAAGGGGNTATANAPVFMLTKASVVPMPSTGATGATATAAAPQAKGPAATQYRLSGSDSMVGLYEGKQVQMTGTIDTSTTGRGAAGAAATPTLKVDTVYVRAASCS